MRIVDHLAQIAYRLRRKLLRVAAAEQFGSGQLRGPRGDTFILFALVTPAPARFGKALLRNELGVAQHCEHAVPSVVAV